MPEQVNVPAVGRVDRKWVLAGGAAVAGIVAYAWWRRGASPVEVPPGEGDVVADDLAYSPDAYAGATLPGGAAYDPADHEDTTPMTNAEWSQRVVEVLGGLGFEPQFVASTIGKYLSGQQLTTAEKLLVQTAKGMVGPPPAGDLPIIAAPDTPAPVAGTNKLATPALRVSAGNPRNTNYLLTWNKVPGAVFYVVKRELGPGSPTSLPVFGTSRRTPALRHHYTYQYRVQAQAPGYKLPSNWSAPVRFKVP